MTEQQEWNENKTTQVEKNNPQQMVFRMLKRGNKGKVEAKELLVPMATSLAQQNQRKEDLEREQQTELKRLVLQNMEVSENLELEAQAQQDLLNVGLGINNDNHHHHPALVGMHPLNERGKSNSHSRGYTSANRGRGYRTQFPKLGDHI